MHTYLQHYVIGNNWHLEDPSLDLRDTLAYAVGSTHIGPVGHLLLGPRALGADEGVALQRHGEEPSAHELEDLQELLAREALQAHEQHLGRRHRERAWARAVCGAKADKSCHRVSTKKP